MSEREDSNLMLLYGVCALFLVLILGTYILTWILG
jgi:hypothetical protein